MTPINYKQIKINVKSTVFDRRGCSGHPKRSTDEMRHFTSLLVKRRLHFENCTVRTIGWKKNEVKSFDLNIIVTNLKNILHRML